MPTLTLTEVVGEPRPWSPKDHPERVFHSYRVKDDKGTVYEINRKPESGPPKLGPDEYEITPAKGDFPPKLKRVQQNGSGGFSGGGMSPERQRAVQRQHSQEMSLRLLTLMLALDRDRFIKQMDEDAGLWSMVERWTDKFDADVNDVDGSGGAPPMVQSPSASSTAALSAANGSAISEKQLAFMDRLLREAGVDVQDRLDIGAWAKEKLTGGQGGSASAAIEAIKSGDDGITRLLTAAKGWVDTQPTVPGDERDLQPAPASVIGAAGSDIEF
jgi:hypothetical protein